MKNNNKEEFNMKKTKMSAKTIVLGAILTALVILLQYVSIWIRFGTFSITLSLVPIVIGAIVCGCGMCVWLGLMFGITVLISGDANFFLSFNVIGTIITVLFKGMLCGFFAGVTYKALKKIMPEKKYLRIMVSSIICPIVNTGVFILGCYIFFLPDITKLASDAGMSGNIFGFIITAFVTFNFILELVLNIIFAPATAKILKAVDKGN